MVEQSYLSTEEAANILGYSRQHVRVLMRAGVISGHRVGKSWLVPQEAVENFLIRRNNLPLFGGSKRGRPRRGITSG
jgi:excisionase family DNA binding protein